MGPLGRIVGFLLGLGGVFALALGVGSLWGPTVATPTAHVDEPGHAGASGGHGAGGDHLPGGLLRSQDGYSLDLAATTAPAGRGVPLTFTITGPHGSPVTAYDVEHRRRLHLVLVRRDLTGFQHVHPRLDTASATWSTSVDLEPGTWRVFADFRVSGGPALTLGTDLTVPGEIPEPVPITADTHTAHVDGYTVRLDGALVAGREAELVLTVWEGGRPVTDLQPYLGADGHLVILREGDLAYLHVHPDSAARPGPTIGFTAEVPSAGHHRLFLDFRHGGGVHTARFDLTAVSR